MSSTDREGDPKERRAYEVEDVTSGCGPGFLGGCFGAFPAGVAIHFFLGFFWRNELAVFFRVPVRDVWIPLPLAALFAGFSILSVLFASTWKARMGFAALAGIVIVGFLGWREIEDSPVRSAVEEHSERIIETFVEQVPEHMEALRVKRAVLAELRAATRAAEKWGEPGEETSAPDPRDLRERPVVVCGGAPGSEYAFRWSIPTSLAVESQAANEGLGTTGLRRARLMGLGAVDAVVRRRLGNRLPEGIFLGPELELMTELEKRKHPNASLVLTDLIADPLLREAFRSGVLAPQHPWRAATRDATTPGWLPLILVRLDRNAERVGKYADGQPAYAVTLNATFLRWPELELLGTYTRRREPNLIDVTGDDSIWVEWTPLVNAFTGWLRRTFKGSATAPQVMGTVPFFPEILDVTIEQEKAESKP